MNLIMNAFAFHEKYGNSMQLGQKSDDEKLNIYMKNMVLSLTSAKHKNPEDEVMLVANMEIPAPFDKQLTDKGVKIKIVPFDKYTMPPEIPWSLAFYKLCALEYVSTKENYDKILMIDTDTITMENYGDLWQEAQYGLMLYPVNHTYNHRDRDIIRNTYKQLYPEAQENLVHYGGEFICGTKQVLADFLAECKKVYDRIEAADFKIHKETGDEAILSIAAIYYKKNHDFFEAGAYIYRYWTVYNYLISTNTINNPVCIWHLPGEKDRGIIYVYDYYMKHGTYPSKEKAAHIFGIYPAKRPKTLLSFIIRVQRKLRSMKAKK